MHTIPVVDLADDPAAVTAAIDAASRQVGFFQVVHHGIDRARLDAVYAALGELTALPVEVREHLAHQSGHPFRGLHLNRDASGRVRQQRFHAGRFDSPEAAVAAGIPAELSDYYQPNVWPDAVPGFESAVRALFADMAALGDRLMRLCAVALGAPGAFDDALQPHASSFAVNHYPASGEHGDVPPVVFDAHADGNTLTVLHQRGDYVGLEVQRLDDPDVWIGVPVRDDAFVINVGELLTRWTNGAWPSTRHRVVAAADPVSSRISLTAFHMPALDAVLAPLAVCGGDTAPHYEPITPYEADRQLMLRRYRTATETTHFSDEVYAFVNSLGQ